MTQSERRDAVLAAVDALGAHQRDLNGRVGAVEAGLGAVETRLGAVETTSRDTNGRVRSLEDDLAEVRDLLVRALDR